MTRRDPPPGSASHFARAPHTAWRLIGDETVILDQRKHRLLGLNDMGGGVWHRLDTPRSVADLAAALALPAAQVESFLVQLVDLGLAESQSGAVPSAKAGDPSADDPAKVDTAPAITWQEPLQNAAQTAGGCAFLPGQNPLCNSTPFS